MKGSILEGFGPGASSSQGHMQGSISSISSFKRAYLGAISPGSGGAAGAHEGAHPGGIRLRSQRGQGHMQGHMKGHILEEFGSGARGAWGTCRET